MGGGGIIDKEDSLLTANTFSLVPEVGSTTDVVECNI